MKQALVHRTDERVGVVVADLAERGFRVDVPTQERSAVTEDLAARGQLTHVEEPDPLAYALVVDASAHLKGVAPDARSSGSSARNATGAVVLVGGGPGDPGLLTVAGLEAVKQADVVVYDRLAPLASLAQARPDAELVNVGKIPRGEFTPQETINALLVERAREGKHVVRLKGGDNFVFGRGGEEWLACADAGVPVTLVPGVTSAVAVPALAGIPLTHRSLTQGFSVVSGHVPPGDPRCTVDWRSLATGGLTIVVLMGVANLRAIAGELQRHGLAPTTPAACIADGATPTQRHVVTPLADLADAVARGGLEPPAITVIGDVVTALGGADG